MEADRAVKTVQRRCYDALSAVYDNLHEYFEYDDECRNGRYFGEQNGQYADNLFNLIELITEQVALAYEESNALKEIVEQNGLKMSTFGQTVFSDADVTLKDKKYFKSRDEWIAKRINFETGEIESEN